MRTEELMNRLIIALTAYSVSFDLQYVYTAKEVSESERAMIADSLKALGISVPSLCDIRDMLKEWIAATKGEEYAKYIRKYNAIVLTKCFHLKFPPKKYGDASAIMAIRDDVQEYIERIVMCRVNDDIECSKKYQARVQARI